MTRQRLWQIKMTTQGRCMKCGRRRQHYRAYCDYCQQKSNEAQRRRLGRRRRFPTLLTGRRRPN